MKFFFRFCLFLTVLFLVYTFYKSEIYFSGNNQSYFLFYYVLSIIFIFFFTYAGYLNIKKQKYIVITLSSVSLILYCFETYLFFNSHKFIFLSSEKKEIVSNFDTRTIELFYKDLKKKNEKISISISPKSYLNLLKENIDFLPLSGISNSETIFCNESGYFSIYLSDRYGFNNPDKNWDSREIEYLILGDALAQGACVNRPHDIGSRLRQYSKKNVLNLGQYGNGPLISLATLKEYYPSEVKKVLWLYDQTDINDLNVELKYEILKNYLNDHNFKQNLKYKQNKIDKLLTWSLENQIDKHRMLDLESRDAHNAISEVKKYYFTNLIKLTNIRGKYLHTRSTPFPPEYKIVLKLAKDMVDKNNGKLYFVYLPNFQTYSLSKIDHNKKQLKKIVSDLNIEFIDIDEEVFKKEKYPLNLFSNLGGHFNIEGYKKISLKIYEKTNLY